MNSFDYATTMDIAENIDRELFWGEFSSDQLEALTDGLALKSKPVVDNIEKNSHTILALLPRFLDYRQHIKRKQESTVRKNRDILNNLVKRIGNLDVRGIDLETISLFMRLIISEDVKEAHQANFINTLKVFLRYCDKQLGLKVIIDYDSLEPPNDPERIRDIVLDEELKKFIDAIKIKNKDGKPYIPGLKFRSFVEVLKTTGARLAEALNIKIQDIEFERKRIKIIGKGNRQRRIFLDDRTIYWIKKYLKVRKTDSEYLFENKDGAYHIQKTDVSKSFIRYRNLAGIKKKICPQVLRRTFATKLIKVGVDIFKVKELLGHKKISTTIRYYVVIDDDDLQKSHQEYLHYDI